MKRIPNISDKKLETLVKKVKPVVRCSRLLDTEIVEPDPEGDLLCYIEYDDPRMDNFIRDPKPKSVAEGLKHLADIKTYHKFGVPVLFSPSIAEVLAQIPKKYLDEVVAFETIAHGLGQDNFVDDYHVTVTRLYRKE